MADSNDKDKLNSDEFQQKWFNVSFFLNIAQPLQRQYTLCKGNKTLLLG
jgi:hypothetical protein